MARQINIDDVRDLILRAPRGGGDSHPAGQFAGRSKLGPAPAPAEWAAVYGDGSMDLAVKAEVGDEIVASTHFRYELSGGWLFFDFRCISGTSGRLWSSGLVPHPDNYSPFAYTASTGVNSTGFEVSRRVLPSDLDVNGYVILRLVYRVFFPAGVSASNITFFDDFGGGLMQHRIRNYGSDKSVAMAPGTSAFHKGGSVSEGALQEPSVWQDRSYPIGHPMRWNMLYTGGWTTAYTGWATASKPGGPWTDRGIVIGNGIAGAAGQAMRNTIYYDENAPTGQKLTVFYSDAAIGNRVIRAVQGDTPANLVNKGVVASPPANIEGYDNCCVLKDGNEFVMMVEGTLVSSPGNYVMGIAKSSSLLGPYTIETFPVSGVGFGRMVGGPVLFKQDDLYILWFHCGFAQRGSTNSFILPTEGMRAVSTDLVNWQQPPSPILKRTHPYEVDQVADLFVVKDDDGEVHMYWTANDNEAQRGFIMYASPLQSGLRDI